MHAGLADGVYAFHTVSIDTRGRTTRQASHYRFRIGEDPGVGTAIGSVSGPSGPISGATVSIQRGLFPEQDTNSTGEFALNSIPAGTWELRVQGEGYETSTQMITIEADGSTSAVVTLTAL